MRRSPQPFLRSVHKVCATHEGVKKQLALLTFLSCAAPAHAGDTPWVRGVNAWGGQGLMRTEAAPASVPGELVIFAAETGYYARSLFKPNDRSSAFDTTAGLVWTPLWGLQLGLDAAFVSFSYTDYVTYSLRAVGNPTLHAKYGYELAPGWALGASVQGQLFTMAQAGDITQTGYFAGVQALLTWHMQQLWEASLNVGFVYDRTAAPFATSSIGDQTRLALGVDDSSHFTWSAGAVRRFPQVWLDPFVEVTGSVGGATLGRPARVQVTPGVRLDTAYGGPVEVTLGAHVRALGAPAAGAGYAGLPPWQVFVQVAVHMFGTPESEVLWNRRSCSSDTECGAQQLCIEGSCVVQAQRMEPAKLAPLPPLVLHGTVTDARTHAPLPKAQLTVSDYAQAPLHANAEGHYQSFALQLTGKLLTITAVAPGYQPQTKTAVAQPSQGETPLDFALEPGADRLNGTVQAFIHVQGSKTPIVGAVAFVPAVGLHAKSDAQGALALSLPEGEYDMLFTAKQHGDARRHVVVRSDTVVQVDVELKRLHKRR